MSQALPTVDNFQELQQKYPEVAQAVQTAATKAVLDVEHHLGDLPGKEKADKARQQTIEILKKTYAGADMVFNFPAPVDYLVNEALIPLLPGLINWIVDLFNGGGEFHHGAGGVQ